MAEASLGCVQRRVVLSEAEGNWTSLASSLSRSRTSTRGSWVTPSESLCPAQTSGYHTGRPAKAVVREERTAQKEPPQSWQGLCSCCLSSLLCLRATVTGQILKCVLLFCGVGISLKHVFSGPRGCMLSPVIRPKRPQSA